MQRLRHHLACWLVLDHCIVSVVSMRCRVLMFIVCVCHIGGIKVIIALTAVVLKLRGSERRRTVLLCEGMSW